MAYCLFVDGEAPFKVKLSGDQPVDVYFLMDFSGSMSDEKNNLHSTATDIANAIRGITPDYQIGFGGFCDKPIPQFGSS